MFFINGVYYQAIEATGIGHTSGLGSVAIRNGYLISPYYHGVFGVKPSGVWEGIMNDMVGYSRLSEITFEKDALSFVKQYDDTRREPLIYNFTKQADGWWTGTWSADFQSGKTRCLLTEFDSERMIDDMKHIIAEKKHN